MTDPSAASDRDLKVQELIAAYLDAEAAGEAPDSAAWLAQHGGFADELRQFLEDHQHMAAIGRPLREAAIPAGSRGSEHPTMDSALSRGQIASPLGTVR